MSDFDKWFEAQGYIEDDGCYQEKYLAARDAWIAQEERVAGVIERLERYPCCMSCYVAREQAIIENKLKVKWVEFLNKGLL